ncbi:substrate-binding periplasmic protein [Massilia cavernae]|uniref:Amino acid ABC transporter substrate-binding protein n=1 Tax=Massilia cavernae TaxID=2320864 RepID=A0A418XFC2_9BURK|nr:transporter substrate-binding domain-containing protein [Massilia cavernae]RJG11167.1 amino acid ABC transporter substrate-binding protein [Massilia cavernae]
MLSYRAGAMRALLAAACLLGASLPVRADWDKIRQSGSLKVAVYKELAPFSNNGEGIDVDLAQALSKKLGLRMVLLPFPADEEVADDLRHMVWKGHYLGYGPADVMLHVPVDKHLMSRNEQVRIFAPYHVETVRLVRNAGRIPAFDSIDALAGRKVGVEKVSISGMLLLGEGNGRFRDTVRIYPSAIEALHKLKEGELDAVLAKRSEIESVFRGDSAFPLHDVAFPRMPRSGWAVGMAVKKDDTDTARLLQKAMNELSESGELARIFARHGVQVVKP